MRSNRLVQLLKNKKNLVNDILRAHDWIYCTYKVLTITDIPTTNVLIKRVCTPKHGTLHQSAEQVQKALVIKNGWDLITMMLMVRYNMINLITVEKKSCDTKPFYDHMIESIALTKFWLLLTFQSPISWLKLIAL